MTEFQELIKDAPKFASMELGELIVCAYAMYAENTKLRDDVERMFRANVEKNGEITKLLDENIKLRKLVQDMWFWHYEGHIDSESQERQMKHIDGVLDRMRELGIG